MKDVSAMLRRIDEELTATRQQIAALQVNIVRLEDARRVVMGIAETDQAASQERAALLPGSVARPQLIVRPTGSGEALEATGQINGKPVKPKRKARGSSPTGSAALRPKILALLKKGEPLTSSEIGDRLGLPPGVVVRKGMSNALYQMRANGILERGEGDWQHKRYSIAEASA